MGSSAEMEFSGTGMLPGDIAWLQWRSQLPPFLHNRRLVFPGHNQVMLQSLTRQLIIHSIQKETVSQVFPNSLVKTTHPVEVV